MNNKELAQYLEGKWRFDNHPKYRHLFADWLTNITEAQAVGFEAQMQSEKNGSMITWNTKK